MMDRGTFRLAAVVLNYNASGACKKCLDYLTKQDYKDLQIIVVDNGSTAAREADRLKELCRNAGAELILHPENRGFSAGNNIGLKAAAARGAAWMLVLNPDVALRDPHYISYVVSQLEQWPEAAVVGTNVLLPGGRRQNPMRELRWYEEIFWPVEKIRQKLGLWDGYLAKDQTGYCEKVSGCCFFISREFLEQNRYLDEHVFLYCEEPILAKSVQKAGWKELYLREVTANHEHRHQSEGNAGRMLLFLKSRIYYIEHYSGYPPLLKKWAVFSKKAEMAFWKQYGAGKGKRRYRPTVNDPEQRRGGKT